MINKQSLTVDNLGQELTWEDMVIAFSTIPGYVSNRDKEKGTWFIQSVCKVSTSRLVDNITIQIPC